MNVLRTIETFLPYVCGPANQAYQISSRLEETGIRSPVLTTYCDIDPSLSEEEVIGRVRVSRFRNQFQLMRYCVSLGMLPRMKGFDILHAHNYRNFQSDAAFFLPV